MPSADDVHEIPGIKDFPNTNFTDYPVVEDFDGRVEVMNSTSFNIDGKEVLVPMVDKKGRLLNEDEAFEQYQQTKEHFGTFEDPESASRYADTIQRHMKEVYGVPPDYDPMEGPTDSPEDYGVESSFGSGTAADTLDERRAIESTPKSQSVSDQRMTALEESRNGMAMENGAGVGPPPTEKRVYGKIEKERKQPSGPPSLKNYTQFAADSALNNASAASVYPEDSDPQLTQAMQKSDPIAQKLAGLGSMSAGDRAKTGAAVGAIAASNFMGGKEGAFIGGSIGAVVARGAGMAQSGEKAKLDRDNRIWSTMKRLGAVAPDGAVKFDDATVQMPEEATGRLKNMRIDPLNGNRDRSLYELDGTNPLTQKSMTVSKPIAMYLANGILGYRDKKNPIDVGAPKSATAMYANMFSDGARDPETVFSRSRQMVKKMGLKEADMRMYFNSIKRDVSIAEAEDIKKGLDILFAK